MADLNRKKIVREGHRGVAKKRLTEAEELVKAVKEERSVDELNIEQIKSALKDRLEILKKLDEEIVDLIEDGEQVIAEIEAADNFNEVISKMLIVLNSLRKPVVTSSARSQESMTKLPKLNLPGFSGELTEWLTFWDSFNAAVHSNVHLSDIQRFTYLKSLLSKSASDAIAGLALTGINYKEAIKILQERFGNKERIISKHMDALLNLDEITNNGNTAGLRTLHDKVETHIRELHALGVVADAYKSLLPSVLMKKLPQELCLFLSRRVKEADWNLDNLMKQFSEELTARERTEKSQGSTGQRRTEDRHKVRFKSPPTVAALHTRGYNTCCYCESNHSPEFCTKVTDVEARKRVIRESDRCYVCLKKGHVSKVCHSSGRCSQCRGRHHTSICHQHKKSDGQKQRPSEQKTSSNTPPFKSTSLLTDAGDTILLQTAQAIVNNPESESRRELRLIFDSGSQRSYITNKAKRSLSLRAVDHKEMVIATFGNNNRRIQKCEVVRAGVRVDEDEIIVIKLLTIPTISESVKGVSVQQYTQRFEHLKGLALADNIKNDELIEFDILVGLDYYWQFVSGEIIHGITGPTAVRSRLGWLLSGPVASSATALCTRVLTTISNEKTKLDEQLKQFWELESFGIVDKESELYEQFKEKITFDGMRYEVSLPWKDSVLDIPDNYDLCLRRLKSLLKRLRGDPMLLAEYDKVMQEQLDKGIIEVVNEPEKADGDRIHYLPHHAVIRRDKETTKVRVVYDASAKEKGMSLNECLHIGTNFNQGIFELLLRFRLHKVGFVADVEKAFLMVGIQQSDRDALRFLWVRDIHENPPQWQVLRFTRVTFGVAPSPFLLNATIRYHIECYKETKPDVANKLLQSMYVDDVVSGASSKEESIELFQEFRSLLQEGGFNLRKFVMNGTSNRPGEITKVLGINWNLSEDKLVIDLKSVVDYVDIVAPTKRHIVSIVSRLYDPVGFVTPVTIRLKVFLQLLHKEKINWEERVEGKLLAEWAKIVTSMREAEAIAVNRYYLNSEMREIESCNLCGFCDASASAYAAVIYLRCVTKGGITVNLVSSKARVAPLTQQSIPRLELLGALLLARLIHTVTEALIELNLGQPVCYTDSLVTLYWIQGTEKNWKPFVDNRVREIRQLVPVQAWKHCPGEKNPADYPSRGMSPKELAVCATWFQGPEFLRGNSSEMESIEQIMPDACIQELRACERREFVLLVQANDVTLKNLIEIEKYSCLEKLLRVTAYVLKFIALLKARVCRQGECELEGRMLFSALMLQAEQLWIRDAQSTLHEDTRFEREKKQLQLFQDENCMWRCGGRLDNTVLPYDVKHPIILPGRHYFTTLVIWRCHERVFHNGIKETLTELRVKFWVVRGRSLVRRILRGCVVCKRVEGGPYGVPKSPPLPAFRVCEEPPFTHTGIDFAGPLFVKGSVESGEKKVWLCLYTCCVVRGVHLDVLTNMSLENFFRSFRRFVARRGLPSRVLSDNAKTFKGAAKLFNEIMSHEDINQYLPGAKIQWMFNVEKAPWWGGVFERLIRSVKRCLRKVIGRGTLSYDELLTLVTEVEMIINSRPLSYISADDLNEPLTPSHLIIGRRINSLPDNLCYSPNDDEDYSVTRSMLTKRMKYLGRTLDQFWSRWRWEYLIELREAHRYKSGELNGEKISVGDVVIVHNEDKRRGFWKLAKIEELITGRDGLTRAAVIRVHNGKGNSKLLRRPLQRLFPIEISNSIPTEDPRSNPGEIDSSIVSNENLEEQPMCSDTQVSTNIAPENATSSNSDQEVSTRRSTRAAGKEARSKILAQLLS